MHHYAPLPCSTSLTSKGLRQKQSQRESWKLSLQHLPDFKGIETFTPNKSLKFYTCSTSLTSKGLRQISRLVGSQFLLLQHLPDFKGIETRGCWRIRSDNPLQHLPDFKGIETNMPPLVTYRWPCSTSLTSKGLRQILLRHQHKTQILQHLPDFKGIETWCFSPCTTAYTLQHLPDFKGIETSCPILWHSLWCLAAPPWLQRDWDWLSYCQPFDIDLQHLPDFKGIETQYAYLVLLQTPCSTSLTSKGLRPWESIACARSLLAAPPWLQRDWDPIQ